MFASLIITWPSFTVTFVSVAVAQVIYVVVALIWLVPDRRLERQFQHGG